jgi:hypothetical protein
LLALSLYPNAFFVPLSNHQRVGELGRILGEKWRGYNDDEKAVSDLVPHPTSVHLGSRGESLFATPTIWLCFDFVTRHPTSVTRRANLVLLTSLPNSLTLPSTRRPRPSTPQRRLPTMPRRAEKMMRTRTRTLTKLSRIVEPQL